MADFVLHKGRFSGAEQDSYVKIDSNKPGAAKLVACSVQRYMSCSLSKGRSRIVICIGSDRSTGDALGPLVGTQLIRFNLPRTEVWGTLAQPVHAQNLESFLGQIEQKEAQSVIIAVDASLGNLESVGMIQVGKGPLYPGAGVHKKLPPIGDIYLSGIVNLGGFMEQMVLQSTRLYQVMKMANIISLGLKYALARI